MLSRPLLLTASRLLAISLPAALILYLVTQTGPLPDNDYWAIVAPIISGEGFSWRLDDWLARSNEHLVVIPKLLYMLNILATDGHNTGLALIAWLSALLVVVLLSALTLPTAVRSTPAALFWYTLLLALFVFTPRASHNWLMGMSGVAWISANLFALLAITGLYRLAETNHNSWLLVSIGAGLCGALTYSTALAVWPALLFGALALRLPPRRTAALLIACISVYTLYLAGYDRPGSHPDITLSATMIGGYLLAFLGSSFTLIPEQAQRIGVAGVLAFAALTLYLLSLHSRPRLQITLAPWVLIPLYVLGTALMAALSRSGFGELQALSSRYASLPALFWASLLVAALLVAREFRPRPRVVVAAAITALAALSVGAMYRASLPHAQLLLEREREKPLAALSLAIGIHDLELLRRSISKAITGQLLGDYIGIFRQLGHLPFAAPYSDCPRVGSRLTSRLQDPGPGAGVRGSFDTLTPFQPGAARIDGWAYSASGRLDCIAVADGEGVVRGAALVGFPRPDLARSLTLPEPHVGWKGFAALPPKEQPLTAYARMEQSGEWVALQRSQLAKKGNRGYNGVQRGGLPAP